MSRRDDHAELRRLILSIPDNVARSTDATKDAAIRACVEHDLRHPSTGLVTNPVDLLDRRIVWLNRRIAELQAQAEAREAVIAALKARMVTGGAE